MSRALLVSLLLLLALCWGTLSTHGQNGSSEPVPEVLTRRVTDFLKGLSLGETGAVDGSVQGSFNSLLKGSPLEGDAEKVQAIVTSTLELENKGYGRYRGVEEVQSKIVGNDLVLMKYLYKFDRFPVVWHFTFYRSGLTPEGEDNWLLVTVRFDTDLELLAL